ncbi:unnamed protein product, partial [Iphiclides podalirius]
MLEFAKKEICAFLNKNSINELVFIPYAQNNFNEYTKKIKDIIDPWGFSVTGLVPFNINPHYIDKNENETHKGETRDQRINEFIDMPYAKAVLGLREGSILHIDGNSLTIKGVAGAVLFKKGQKKTEYCVGDNVSFLFEE